MLYCIWKTRYPGHDACTYFVQANFHTFISGSCFNTICREQQLLGLPDEERTGSRSIISDRWDYCTAFSFTVRFLLRTNPIQHFTSTVHKQDTRKRWLILLLLLFIEWMTCSAYLCPPFSFHLSAPSEDKTPVFSPTTSRSFFLQVGLYLMNEVVR